MTNQREIPAALYAAAGAGDLAYQRLRKLPEVANRTLRAAGETAATWRQRVTTGQSRLNRDRLNADLATLRESAQRGATAVVTRAAVAQERAVTGYRNLVAHGEHVVAARAEAARMVEPAEIEPPAPAPPAAPPAEERTSPPAAQ